MWWQVRCCVCGGAGRWWGKQRRREGRGKRSAAKNAVRGNKAGWVQSNNQPAQCPRSRWNAQKQQRGEAVGMHHREGTQGWYVTAWGCAQNKPAVWGRGGVCVRRRHVRVLWLYKWGRAGVVWRVCGRQAKVAKSTAGRQRYNAKGNPAFQRTSGHQMSPNMNNKNQASNRIRIRANVQPTKQQPCVVRGSGGKASSANRS